MLTLCSGVDAKWGVGLNIAGHAEWNSKCWTGSTADADVCLLNSETGASGVSESHRTIIDALLEKWLIYDKGGGRMEQQVHASGHVFTGDYACCAMKSSFPLFPVSTGAAAIFDVGCRPVCPSATHVPQSFCSPLQPAPYGRGIVSI